MDLLALTDAVLGSIRDDTAGMDAQERL